MTGKFRLKKDTMGIITATHRAEIVPKGSIIEIAVSPPENVHLVDILWHGKPMMMFLQDILARGEVVVETR